MFTQSVISKIVEDSKLSSIKIKGLQNLVAIRHESSSGYVSGLLLGYFIDGELRMYDKFVGIDKDKNQNIYAIVLIKDNKENKSKLVKLETSINYIKYSLTRPTANDIEALSLRIIDSELSARVFGLKSLKSSLINNVYNNYKIDTGTSRKLEHDINYILIPHDEASNGGIKFLLSDVEFLLPNLKGWNPPKDKTIKIASKVIFKADSQQQRWLVLDVKYDNTSKRIAKNSSNRYKDLITVRNLETGFIKKVYAKHLKLV